MQNEYPGNHAVTFPLIYHYAQADHSYHVYLPLFRIIFPWIACSLEIMTQEEKGYM